MAIFRSSDRHARLFHRPSVYAASWYSGLGSMDGAALANYCAYSNRAFLGSAPGRVGNDIWRDLIRQISHLDFHSLVASGILLCLRHSHDLGTPEFHRASLGGMT